AFVRSVVDVHTHSLATTIKTADGAETLSIHTLVHYAVARSRPASEKQKVKLQDAIIDILNERLTCINDIRQHSRLALYVLHARHLVMTAHEENMALTTLMGQVAQHDYERGIYASARALQERSLAIHQRISGPEHPDTLGSMNNLA